MNPFRLERRGRRHFVKVDRTMLSLFIAAVLLSTVPGLLIVVIAWFEGDVKSIVGFFLSAPSIGIHVVWGVAVVVGLTIKWRRVKRDLARRRRRLCLTCGYPLRGLPTGRCPECGTLSTDSGSGLS